MCEGFRIRGCLTVCAVILAWSMNAESQSRVKASLISDTEIAAPGSTIRVGVLFTIPARAHIYWHNPGDAGLATGIEWDTDLAMGDLQWPAPMQFAIEGLNEAYFGYTKEVLLYSEVNIPEEASPNSRLTIRAKTYWLLCLDDGECIPDEQQLEITIPIAPESRLAYESTLFTRFAARIPRVATIPTFKIHWTESSFTVTLPDHFGSITQVANRPIRFFPNEGGGWTPRDINASSITFTPDYAGDKPGGGVLVLPTIETSSGIPTTYYLSIHGPKSP
ncbi:MAG: hypothetical protein COA73_10930 [Candidatus Hydrogenedentota bacterium]|nr:MAG: hypothetical protein COA73_10930 [Candidatus Hydrogenedentota bacterium]